MSSGTSFATANGIRLALILATLLPRVAQAVSPSALPHAGTPMKEEKTSTAPVTHDRPGTTAVRSPASLTRQTPLGEAVDLLRNSTTPPLKIIVLWKPLGEAGIYRDTPIGIDGSAGLSASQYVEFLVLSLSAGASARLGYIVDKDVITIATTDALPAPKHVTRVYDISDLVAPPARYSLSSMGFTGGYGNPVVPPGGPVGNPGYGSYGASSPSTNLSRPARSTSGRTGQSTRSYRGR